MRRDNRKPTGRPPDIVLTELFRLRRHVLRTVVELPNFAPPPSRCGRRQRLRSEARWLAGHLFPHFRDRLKSLDEEASSVRQQPVGAALAGKSFFAKNQGQKTREGTTFDFADKEFWPQGPIT